MRVLIVDDEIKLADALGELFRHYNFQTDVVYSGEDALFYSRANDYDLIILDVMMPRMDGYEVVSTLRNRKNNVPVLMLTAKDDTASKVKGLDCGADDYLAKPFASEELLARARALTRRKQDIATDEIEFGDIKLNTLNYTLSCGAKQIALGAKEYGIMHLMLSNPQQVMSKDVIISKVWGFDSDVTENNIEAYMSFLRKKLQYIESKVNISTKRMLGYYLEYAKGDK